jgi:hypothetical protein
MAEVVLMQCALVYRVISDEPSVEVVGVLKSASGGLQDEHVCGAG